MVKGFMEFPYAKQFDEMNKSLRSIAGEKGIDDFENHPGSKVLRAGTKENGFYGFVQPSEMGEIEEGGEGFKEYNGSNLCLAVGLSAGTLMASEVPLMKFSRHGKVLLVPTMGYRHTVTWNAIYNAGLVYGSDDDGLLPPNGRLGINLTLNETDNSIVTTEKDFLTSGYTVGAVGDTITLKGWSKEGNNGDFTIKSITDEKIIVNETLVSESGSKLSRVYKKDNGVKQNKIVTIGGKKYRVRLMQGAGDVIADLSKADRGSTGKDNEWNALILPLHEHAKLGNWNYPAYAKSESGGLIEDWGVGLTDENLRTHHVFGTGNYTWCQETRCDIQTYRRGLRGYYGASISSAHNSGYTNSHYVFRPVFESL